MTDNQTGCPHPTDTDACQEALLTTYRQDTLAQHCIFAGLTNNMRTCRQILRECLYPQINTLNRKKGDVDIQTLAAVGKQVIQLGYPRNLPALQETFFEAFHKLIWTVIYRYGMTDTKQPSADDAYQETRMDLHAYFRKGPAIHRSLAGYISKVTINACNRLCKKETKHQHQDMPLEEQIKGPVLTGNKLIPPGVIECWEELDKQLSHSPKGDIYNRIILAQQCLEMYLTEQKPTAKQLIPAWQELSHISEEHQSRLYDSVIRQRKHSDRQGWISLVAEMINQGYAEWNQVRMALPSISPSLRWVYVLSSFFRN